MSNFSPPLSLPRTVPAPRSWTPPHPLKSACSSLASCVSLLPPSPGEIPRRDVWWHQPVLPAAKPQFLLHLLPFFSPFSAPCLPGTPDVTFPKSWLIYFTYPLRKRVRRKRWKAGRQNVEGDRIISQLNSSGPIRYVTASLARSCDAFNYTLKLRFSEFTTFCIATNAALKERHATFSLLD